MSIRCCYQDCLSVKNPCSVITFFNLPSDGRRNVWIKNSGNKALLNLKTDAKRYFCENHFQECDIRTQFNRKILRRHAVPLEYVCLTSTAADDEDYEFIQTIPQKKNIQTLNTQLCEALEENSNCQDFYEIKLLNEPTTESASPDDGTSNDPYNLMDVYEVDDGSAAASTSRMIVQQPIEEDSNTKVKDVSELELYIEESCDNTPADSSTVEIENLQENIEMLDYDGVSEMEPKPQAKKKRPNDPEVLPEKPNILSTEVVMPANRSNESYEEDKHFALSLVGYFQRLPQKKKSMAKLKILQYLTELEVDYPACL